jgi:hypothetical protein
METKVCPKCQNEYPKTPEYFFFYHKKEWPEGKIWIHTYCRQCERERVLAKNNKKYIHKRELPSPQEVIEAREKLEKSKTHRCPRCKYDLPLTTEYWYYSHKHERFEIHICKECKREKARINYNKVHKVNPVGDGIWDIQGNPGEYNSKEEKDDTFQFMELMGWKYSESQQRWFKPGLKNKYGVWNMKQNKTKRIRK